MLEGQRIGATAEASSAPVVTCSRSDHDRTMGKMYTLLAKEQCMPCGRLTEVPDAIGALKSLQRFSLAHNSLTQLPGALDQLTALRRLDLRHNQLQSLPGELGGCCALEELDAAENCLDALPDSLGQLQNLRSLLLDKNRSALLACQLAYALLCLRRVTEVLCLAALLHNIHALCMWGVCQARGFLASTKCFPCRCLCIPRLKAVPAAVLRSCRALATLGLHGNPVTVEQLRASDGFAEFNARRCAKHDKQVWFLMLFLCTSARLSCNRQLCIDEGIQQSRLVD